ncbi:hypothetical protein FU659_18175 [Paenibacillus sp. N3.4]|nr:hypothetical protein FU659_18175 [Paenibacillus sp. N3.4]
MELNGQQRRYSSNQRPMSTIFPHLTERMSGSRRKTRDKGQITAVMSRRAGLNSQGAIRTRLFKVQAWILKGEPFTFFHFIKSDFSVASPMC